MTQKQKSKLARKHGGFTSTWWEKRKFRVLRKVHDIQTKAHIMAQIKRGDTPTLLNGDPLPDMRKKKEKK